MVKTSAQATIHIFEVILALYKYKIKDLKGAIALENYSYIRVATYEDFDKHNNNGTLSTACWRQISA